jgi:hypothetical protein
MKRVLLAVVLASCSRATVDDPAPPAAETRPAPAASRPTIAPAPAAEAWRWRTSKDDPEFMVTPLLRLSDAQNYRFVADPDHKDPPRVERVDIAGNVAWSAKLEPQFFDAAAMVHAGDRVLVAHHSHIATGCRLVALDADTGAVAWQTELVGRGPVSHSKYRNRVQLRVDAGRAVVYGWETEGRYIETVDLDTGETLDNTRPDGDLAALPWRWDAGDRTAFHARRDPLPIEGGGAYTYEPAELRSKAAIVKRAANGDELWSASLPGEGECGSTALLEHANRLYAVHYCSISSGAEMYAFDAGTGERLHEVGVVGLGPIGHSEYYNDVELRIASGHVVAYGNEAAGHYIEARDPESLALVSSQVFADW